MSHHLFRGTPGAPYRVIGAVELTAAIEATDRGFQNASWWRKMAIEPQTATLRSNGYYVTWAFDGTVIEDNFASQYGGVNIGTYDHTKNAGKIERYTYRPYAYDWAKQQMTGEGYLMTGEMVFHLLPEYGIGCAPYKHDPAKRGYFLLGPAGPGN